LASQPSTNSVSRIFKQAILAGNLFLGRWGNSFNYICFKKARDATVNSTLAPIPGIRFRSFRTVK
jgi:hypothetical protein